MSKPSLKRIMLVLPDLRFGGAQRVMLELARRFLALGLSVHIVNLSGSGELIAEVPEAARYWAPKRTTVDAKAWLAVTSAFRLWRMLRRERPDAVLSTMTGTNIVTLAAARLARYAGTVVVREAASTLNASKMMNWLMRVSYGRADRIVTVSEGVAADLALLGLPPDRLLAIPNPIDANRILGLAGSEPVPETRPYIISVGRLTVQKDHSTLLDAYAKAGARKSHDLVIVGGGPESERLRAQVLAMGLQRAVHLTGPLENPYPLMRRAALFVLSSRWEGYPNVLLEAVTLGLPVVSTDCRSGPSELLAGGRFGRLAAAGDSEALAQAIDDELATPSECGEELVRRHAPDAIAARYITALEGKA
ncbi:Glycosyltransferase involved in cell wall bisynthesis [Luteibacter sp. UNC138MFCol5.1]|uniref:glycosyltransferase n=1 Tax=Luteibacter sp. UNC138MFCol5.1 TaxID=1502774 RepID=UPI0008ADF8CE|nr:glycosyltransferase [Luteibacter sp. UNC138MFCol5.1]SEO84665.1 Glycosyltransferase involved in cell wall bisynthesis [Luteibacter sp. UNC138MFCol5.1]